MSTELWIVDLIPECPGSFLEEVFGDGRKELIELTEVKDSDGVERFVEVEEDIEEGIDCSLFRIVEVGVELFLRT